MSSNEKRPSIPHLAVDVTDSRGRSRSQRVACRIGPNIRFSTSGLESYLFAPKEEVVYDALVVAGAVEFADRVLRRPPASWRREFDLAIAVHDPDRWRDPRVFNSLRTTLELLTGDDWRLSFHGRKRPVDVSYQGRLTLPAESTAVIPFSDGLDSRAVAGLMAREFGHGLQRVRLGSKPYTDQHPRKRPFATVPYRVRSADPEFKETSARSRGFKFALISGLAAYLSKASRIIVPESGQGALGPALVPVGQMHEDYRNHPVFTARMELFLNALLSHQVCFEFPRLWFTKGQTLREFVDQCDDGDSWAKTWSCWQQNRHSSVDGKRRHCGVCAACILRRLSVHAAGLEELPETYVWENLAAPVFEQGAASTFPNRKKTDKMRRYAIAGLLHMDHLAGLRSSPANAWMVRGTACRLARLLNITVEDATEKLDCLLQQHEREWKAFLASTGESSFVAQWLRGCGR